MRTIQDILQFHFSPTTFKQSAQKIIPVALSTLNDHRIDKLQKITQSVGENSFDFSRIKDIPQVFRKFKESIKTPNIRFDKKELRILTYSLSYSEPSYQSIFSNKNELNSALTLLDSNWRDSFLTGLIDCFLRNWETESRNSLELLENFGASKLNNYEGSRPALISFKNNKRFFSTKNGDLILGDTIAKLNKPINEATKILGMPESWFSYSYFSKVIVTYYERKKNNITNEIENLNDALKKHNSSITNKRLISKIIIQANQPPFTILQDKIKSIAFKQIGDPENISNWAPFENATEAEKKELKQARSILNEWITQQFINVFFNVCINNERRKKFWLRFASKISAFKVYGPGHTKDLLKRDKRVSECVDARFETVFSNRDVSAFILYVGDYMLIEFSSEGYASYAYKTNSPNCPNIKSKLNSVDDLRNSTLPLAITSDTSYYYHSDEGRLFHKDGNDIWETKFNNWMNQKIFK